MFSKLAEFDKQFYDNVQMLPPSQIRGGIQMTLFKGAASGLVGVDEVGRGCLAGPVMAAAVMLPVIEPDSWLGDLLNKLNDSKQVSSNSRKHLAETINACSWCALGSASPTEIDDLNILQASNLAMRRAVELLLTQLPLAEESLTVLVDGKHPLAGVQVKQHAIPSGDRKSASIAAASIVAKVARDQLMLELDGEYEQFGWRANKGYPSERHCDAIAAHGKSVWHRNSFYVRQDRQLKLDLG